MIFAFLLLGSWSSLTGPKTAQEALTTSAQEAPRGSKRLLRGTRRLFRCLQEAPMKHPESRRGPHDAQEAPRCPQEAPKRSQEAPRRPSRGSKRPPGGCVGRIAEGTRISILSPDTSGIRFLTKKGRHFILNNYCLRSPKMAPIMLRLYRAFSMLHKNGNKIADNTHRFFNVAEGGPAAEAEP